MATPTGPWSSLTGRVVSDLSNGCGIKDALRMVKESNDETADASCKKEVTDPIVDDGIKEKKEGELKLAKIDKVPVESNKEEENAREANTEVIAENTDDITIDNSKPNLETAKVNSKGDGNNAAEVSASPRMCDCSISFPHSNLNL